MWFDLIAARALLEKIDWQSSIVLVCLWKALKSKQQIRSTLSAPTISDTLTFSSRGLRNMILFGVGASHTWVEDAAKTVSNWEPLGASWRSHVELTIGWSPRNKQQVTAWRTLKLHVLIHDNPQKFLISLVPMMVTESKQLWPGRSFWPWKLGILPGEWVLSLQYQRTYWALISYKIKVQTSVAEFCLWVRLIKPVRRESVSLPPP